MILQFWINAKNEIVQAEKEGDLYTIKMGVYDTEQEDISTEKGFRMYQTKNEYYAYNTFEKWIKILRG